MELDGELLTALGAGPLADTWEWAAARGLDHQAVVGAAKSLEAEGYVASAPLTTEFWTLTPEAAGYVASGSPEAQLFAAVPAEGGLDDAGLEAAFPGRPELVAIGKGKAMQRKWLAKDKATGRYVRAVAAIGDDELVAQLRAAAAGTLTDDKLCKDLAKRKLIERVKRVHYSLTRGPAYAPVRVRQAAELTKEMLDSGDWATASFKAYNFESVGQEPGGGHVHALMKVRAEFRAILLEMGFAEMPTNRFVERCARGRGDEASGRVGLGSPVWAAASCTPRRPCRQRFACAPVSALTCGPAVRPCIPLPDSQLVLEL